MDDQTRVLLDGVLRFLDKQQETLEGALVVSLSLRKAMKELSPDFEKLYEKHYRAESQGPIKTTSDGFREVLAELIRRLNTGKGKQN